MILHKNVKVLSLFIAIALIVISCKSKDEPEDPAASGFDRAALLKYTADEIILPSYDSLIVKLDTMKKKSTAFTTNPTLTTLTEFRAAWVIAYVEWQKVELFDFGPAFNTALRSYLNIYPTSQSGIANNIANPSANIEVPAAYATQGFPAFDYLLNGVGATDNDILAYYTTDADAAARKAYLTRLTNQMYTKVTEVYTAWTTGGYRTTFINNTGMDLSSSIPLMVNGYVLNYERFIRSGKFGLPSGAMQGGTPTPSIVEAYYKKDISLTLAKTAQNASVGLFNGVSVLTGTEGPSLKTYLDAVDAKDILTSTKLTTVINSQFTATNTKLDLLSENLSMEVQNNNQKMIDVYTEMQKTVGLLKVDMTSALSITITYTDNDGD